MTKTSNQIKTFSRPDVLRSVVNSIHQGRNSWHPSLHEIEMSGRRAVWKDIGDRNWLSRSILGAVLLREARVLKRLEGIAGIPTLYGLVGQCGFVMEKLEARPLPSRRENFLQPSFFDALLEQIQAVHKRGVTHGDLRKMNVLVENWTGRPRLIDFGTAMMIDEDSGAIRRSIWRKTQRIDLLHYAKIKDYYFPDLLTDQEKRWLAYAPWHYRIGHWYRQKIYRPIKHRTTRRKSEE